MSHQIWRTGLSTYLFSFVLYGSIAIVKGKDEQAHGAYHTKGVIIDSYDAIQQAGETDTPYHTRLDPPPAHGWTPPEITLEAATGRQAAGASEVTAYVSADVQRRAESMLSQPAFHFDDT